MSRKPSRLRQLWFETRWILLATVWLAGLLLGYAGFVRYSNDNALGWTVGDTLYSTLQLIVLNSGSVGGRTNWMLGTARFLLPALTLYTALQALAHLFGEQMQWLRLWRLRDHVIVCGMGRKGGHLADELSRLGQQVVLIDREPEPIRAARLQRRRAISLAGDATNRDVLASARLHRARHVICLLGEDRQNLQVAFQARQLTRGRRKGRLTCIVHLASPDLADLVRRGELSVEADVPFEIETFHPYARAAQLLIQEDPGWQEGNDPSAVPAHLLVIGLGRLGKNLVVQAAYAWHKRRQPGRLTITILDREAPQKAAALAQEYPQLASACQLISLSVDLSSARLLHEALKKAPEPQPVQRVYVCLGDPVLSLQICWSLLEFAAYQAAPIRVRIKEKSGLSELLDKPLTARPYRGQVIPFELYVRTCSAELVVGGLHELLARELHERYLRGLGASSTGTRWDQLPEAVKEDNRQQADRIHRLLTAAGYQVKPFQDWSAAEFVFEPDAVVKQMARSEHELWCQAKRAEGWRRGPVRDGKRRTHPDLVPWEELPEKEREKNEAFIRELPSLLPRLGFQIDRAEDPSVLCRDLPSGASAASAPEAGGERAPPDGRG